MWMARSRSRKNACSRRVGEAFGIDGDDFLLMHNWVKRLVALEQEAREFMHP